MNSRIEQPPEGAKRKSVLDNDERWKLALRVAASPGFSKSTRLRDFLLYVCEKTLTDRQDEVHEQQIGLEVFGRRDGYNPSEDNIVRVEARELRKRLDRYFSSPAGRTEELRIKIPKGGYAPCFEVHRSGLGGGYFCSSSFTWKWQRPASDIRCEGKRRFAKGLGRSFLDHLGAGHRRGGSVGRSPYRMAR